MQAEHANIEATHILTRTIGQQIKLAGQGYHVRNATIGFRNDKMITSDGRELPIMVPHEIEAPWFIKLFELSAEGQLSDDDICERINAMGFKTRRLLKRDRKTLKVIGTKQRRRIGLNRKCKASAQNNQVWHVEAPQSGWCLTTSFDLLRGTRRGTGKTTLLFALKNLIHKDEHGFAIYLDINKCLGSIEEEGHTIRTMAESVFNEFTIKLAKQIFNDAVKLSSNLLGFSLSVNFQNVDTGFPVYSHTKNTIGNNSNV